MMEELQNFTTTNILIQLFCTGSLEGLEPIQGDFWAQAGVLPGQSVNLPNLPLSSGGTNHDTGHKPPFLIQA